MTTQSIMDARTDAVPNQRSKCFVKVNINIGGRSLLISVLNVAAVEPIRQTQVDFLPRKRADRPFASKQKPAHAGSRTNVIMLLHALLVIFSIRSSAAVSCSLLLTSLVFVHSTFLRL